MEGGRVAVEDYDVVCVVVVLSAGGEGTGGAGGADAVATRGVGSRKEMGRGFLGFALWFLGCSGACVMFVSARPFPLFLSLFSLYQVGLLNT